MSTGGVPVRDRLKLVYLRQAPDVFTLCINQTPWDLCYPGCIFRIFNGEGEIGSDDEK
jgi:hypothetical protein